MLDWHSCQICYPLEIKILLLLLKRHIRSGLTFLEANILNEKTVFVWSKFT